jgi:hypothetical protein
MEVQNPVEGPPQGRQRRRQSVESSVVSDGGEMNFKDGKLK